MVLGMLRRYRTGIILSQVLWKYSVIEDGLIESARY